MSEDKKVAVVIDTGAGGMRMVAGDTGPAKIIDHVTTAPTIIGEHGRAWACSIAVGRKLKNIRDEDDAAVVHWVVEAPWAHPVWHSYSILLIHLRPMPDSRPTLFYLDGATHEMWVYAINPEMDRNELIATGIVEGIWLHPANFVAQFIELDDDLAMTRIFHTVQAICDGRLSPDTDHRQAWAKLYGNNMIKKAWR